jgi:serine/threonine protein kinase
MAPAISLSSEESIGDCVGLGSRYELVSLVRGGNSTTQVFAAFDRLRRRPCAVKVARKTLWSRLARAAGLFNELKVVRHISARLDYFNGHHVLRLYDTFQDSSRLWLVSELCEGGELLSRVIQEGALSESDAAAVIIQITHAVDALHACGVLHRDLKPENILMMGPDRGCGEVRICDFGLSVLAPWVSRDTCGDDGGMEKTLGNLVYHGTVAADGLRDCKRQSRRFAIAVCGSRGFQAPEVKKPGALYGLKADWWGVGILLYILLVGYPPFPIFGQDETPRHELQWGNFFDREDKFARELLTETTDRCSAQFDHPRWLAVSVEARALVCALLEFDPDKRPDAKKILGHKWIADWFRTVR